MAERLTRPTRLSQPWRKTLLVLHLVSGIGWMGLDIALLVLAVTALRTTEAEVAYSSYRAIAIAFPGPVMLLSFGMALTGILLGWGTHWGLLRSWWVLIKLVLSADHAGAGELLAGANVDWHSSDVVQRLECGRVAGLAGRTPDHAPLSASRFLPDAGDRRDPVSVQAVGYSRRGHLIPPGADERRVARSEAARHRLCNGHRRKGGLPALRMPLDHYRLARKARISWLTRSGASSCGQCPMPSSSTIPRKPGSAGRKVSSLGWRTRLRPSRPPIRKKDG